MDAALPQLQTVRRRLAQHYLNELQAANAAFGRGHDNSAYGLARFDREWLQIKHWQAWSATRQQQDTASASLCAQYPAAGAELLALRQTPQERIAWLKAGQRAARSIHDQPAEVVCTFLLAWALHKQALTEPAQATAGEALALAEAIGDKLYAGRSLHLLGEIAVRQGQFGEARQLHERSLGLLRAVGAQAPLAELYFSLSELSYLEGDFAAARDDAWQSHLIHEALGLSPTTNNSLTWLGITTVEAGDLVAGEGYVLQSIALCRAAGARSTLAHALYVLGGIMLIEKDAERARAAIAESLKIAQAIGEQWLIPYILIERADLRCLVGELSAAAEDVDHVVETARQTGYRLMLSTALIYLAKVQLALGDLGAAGAALREGLALARATRLKIDLVHGLLLAARLWRQLGRSSQAAEWVNLLLAEPGVEMLVRNQVRECCAQLEADLGPAEFATAVERGRSLQFDEVIAQLAEELARENR
jgi:tetratricopeptide (TPR) repeat protein